MNIKKRNFIILLIVFFLAGGGISFAVTEIIGKGVLSGTVKITSDQYDYYTKLEQRYGKLNTLYNTVNEYFYKKTDADNLATGMYKGLMAGLGDAYSTYMTKEEYESWSANTMGEFDGIGITFSMDEKGQLVVVSVISKTPADKAGIKPGDVILAVDGKTYTDMDAAGAAMRGKAGTKVEVVYSRGGKKMTKALVRAKIVNESITSKMLKSNVGYIEISAFEEHTADDFKKALEGMEKKKVKGVVIDLRQNGGGLVDSGVKIADMLLGKGTITYLQDRKGGKQTFSSDASKTDLPYVLLVDDFTASTSEILAAAVKDDGKNKIVGIKTYGKGIVQSTETLDDGSAIKLTTMQYFSPKGNQIHEKGVTPDYVIKSKTKQLDKAIELLK